MPRSGDTQDRPLSRPCSTESVPLSSTDTDTLPIALMKRYLRGAVKRIGRVTTTAFPSDEAVQAAKPARLLGGEEEAAKGAAALTISPQGRDAEPVAGRSAVGVWCGPEQVCPPYVDSKLVPDDRE